MTTYRMPAREIPMDDSYDVIVAGGGPAGCAAAAAAAREGARTLLVEATSYLGGMGTGGLVPFWCGYGDGEKFIARGFAEKVLEACRAGANTPAPEGAADWIPAIDAELLKRIYDDLVTGAGADILFNTALSAVEKSAGGEVSAVLVTNKSGLSAYRAKVYVDCTGDADLAAWAGARFQKGDDRSGDMQPATLCFVLANVDEEAEKKGPRLHLWDPKSPIREIIRSGKYPLIIDGHTCNMRIGPSTWGFNTGHVYGVDNTDPLSTSRALVHGRRMAAQYREALGEHLPAFRNSFLVATGALLGVRETRRVVGDYLLTVEDYRACRSFPDEICRNAFGIDVHYDEKTARRFVMMEVEEAKKFHHGRWQGLPNGSSVGVPYRCLTPKGLRNVLVAGRSISTDRPVNGSIRIMPCCMNTGEAAGIAAAMSAAGAGDVHAVDADRLRTRLKEEGAWLPEVEPVPASR